MLIVWLRNVERLSTTPSNVTGNHRRQGMHLNRFTAHFLACHMSRRTHTSPYRPLNIVQWGKSRLCVLNRHYAGTA